MRASIAAGVLLTAAAVLVIIVSSANGLGIEPYALTGVAVGAVVGLVPDRSAAERLGGFVVGFVVVFVAFAARALLLPDTTGGRVVAAAATCLVCLAVALASRGHLPLWALLLGVAAFSGVYEAPFAAAEPEMATTSMDVATSLLTAVAAGFAVTAAVGVRERATAIVAPRPRETEPAVATDATAGTTGTIGTTGSTEVAR